MSDFLQFDSLLLSTKDAAEKLKHSSQAKILVISDSHGGKDEISRVVSYFGKSVDCLAFCGDGALDLLAVDKTCLPPVIAIVSGNNDSRSYPVSDYYVKIPSSLIFEVCGHKVFLAHGHQYGVYSGIELLEEEALLTGADFSFFGHTHVPFEEKREINGRDVLFLNPGSLCLPRSGSPKSFALVTVFSGVKSPETCFFKVTEIQGKEYYKPYSPESYGFWSW